MIIRIAAVLLGSLILIRLGYGFIIGELPEVYDHPVHAMVHMGLGVLFIVYGFTKKDFIHRTVKFLFRR